MKIILVLILVVVSVVVVCRVMTVTLVPRARRSDSHDADCADWPFSRGNAALTGRRTRALPEKLVLHWKFQAGGAVNSSPVVADGRVFFGCDDKNVYAISVTTGHQLWSFPTEDAVEAAPLCVGGRVYVGSTDGRLYALAAADGHLDWQFETESKIVGAANVFHNPGADHPWILVGSYDGNLYCLDSVSGATVWTLATKDYINSTPAVIDQRVVFGGCDALIHVASAIDGRELHQIDSGAFIGAAAAVAGQRAYVGNYGGGFVCADIQRGVVVWRYDNPDFPILSAPALGPSQVIFGSHDHRVRCLDRDTAEVLWTFGTNAAVKSSPVICGDKVIIGSDDGRLYMINLADGKEVWSYEVGPALSAAPAVTGDVVIVGAADGAVYAFGPPR